MIADITTILWREWRDLLLLRGSVRSGLLNVGIVLGIFGILVPLQTGREWAHQPAALAYWAWLPLFVVSGAVADSFAGERERHTLETLLSTRLPDSAIALGKIAAAVSYAWGIVVAGLLLGGLSVTLAYGHGELLFLPAGVFAGAAAFSLLLTLLMACAGALVSLRAPTVRHAFQRLSIANLVVVFLPLLLFQALPVESKVALVQAVSGTSPLRAALTAAGALVLVDAALLAAVLGRFRRTRLFVV